MDREQPRRETRDDLRARLEGEPAVAGPAAERLLLELATRHPVRVGLVGESPALAQMFETLLRFARSDLPVLVIGEVGAGKEAAARALHLNSRRARAPFVAERCAVLRDPLLLTRLCGHARGAFTGAHAACSGLLDVVDGGTLYLDEIADLSLAAQAVLVRILETGEFRPLGTGHARRVEFRLVASTAMDLRALVGSGLFRRDLYFRVRGAVLRVPPLRERRADVLPLADQVLKDVARSERRAPNELLDCARRALLDYDWPGNVRELRQELLQAIAVAGTGGIAVGELQFVREPAPATSQPAARRRSLQQQLGDVEAIAIRDALRIANGNKAEAARRLGVTRRTLYRRLAALAHRMPSGGGDEADSAAPTPPTPSTRPLPAGELDSGGSGAGGAPAG
jgi:DNA-binding NtrC family response regulator